MKTLAISLSKARDKPVRRRGSGFTILELLVVLSLMAAMTGLVLPQLSRLYESGQRAFERKQVIDDIAALPYLAFQQQREFTLGETSGDTGPLALPEGWTLKVKDGAGILYRSNGFCAGGELELLYDGLVERLMLEAPLCQPGA
jgi:hypothetical protein